MVSRFPSFPSRHTQPASSTSSLSQHPTQRIRGVVVVGLMALVVSGCGGGGGGGNRTGSLNMPTTPPSQTNIRLALFNGTGGVDTTPANITPASPASMGGGMTTNTNGMIGGGGGGTPTTPPSTASDEGGVGRVSNVVVGGRHGIVSVVASTDITALLADPSRTKLLWHNEVGETSNGGTGGGATQTRGTRGGTDRVFDFNPSTTHLRSRPGRLQVTASHGGPENFAPGSSTSQGVSPVLGRVYRFNHRNASLGFMRVYIDARADVAIGHELLGGDHFQITTIGEIAPSNLPRGLAVYTGYLVVARPGGMQPDPANSNRQIPIRPNTGKFAMGVDFRFNKVTSFETPQGLEDNDRLTMRAIGDGRSNSDGMGFGATTIEIDPSTGSFTGEINFTNDYLSPTPDDPTKMRTPLPGSVITSHKQGKIYGQFHGNAARGATGVFHSNSHDILGGFAGATN